MSILNTKHGVYATLGCYFLVYANHIGRHLDFDFFLTINDAVFELAWSDEPEEDSKDNKISNLFASHTCIMLIFAIFSLSAIFNFSKCSMMPRWHHSDSSSERYQEVKSIKTFYAAHISRSQAKSMFGNWTNFFDRVFEIDLHLMTRLLQTGMFSTI